MLLTKIFKIYLLAIGADLVTGIWAAGYEGKLKSSRMRRGMWTTVSEVTALALMSSICALMPELYPMVELIVVAMLFKEGISICENLGRADVWIPPWIKKALEIFSDDAAKVPPQIDDKINKK